MHEKKERTMAKYYRDPHTGKVYNDPEMKQERKTMYPPTEGQKIRILELKDRPEFTGENLDWLLECLQKYHMHETRGGAGKLINLMKQRIREAGGEVD